MKKLMNRFMKEESGQGMVEYGLILVLVSIVVIGVLTAVGTNLSGIFTNIGNTLKSSK